MYQNFIPQYGLLQEFLLLFRSRKIQVTVCLYAPTEVYHHRITDVLNVGVPFHLVSILNDQGSDVQAILRLTSSLRGQLIKCFTTLLLCILIQHQHEIIFSFNYINVSP